MTKKYKFVEDLTSDVMFEAEGRDLKELLEQSSMALFDVVCQREKVKPEDLIAVSVKAENPEKLLYEWLSQLLTESDANEMFFSTFEIKVSKTDNEFVAEGKIWGEPYSQKKGGTVVKGITLYGFKVEKTKKGYKARVACDI